MRTKAPPKVKMLFWLALHGRLWTAERRKRHGLQDDDACALCGQAPESASHLFLGCVFSRQVWYDLLAPLELQVLLPDDGDILACWWTQQRRRIDTASRPLFDALLLLVSWCIWKERNVRVFNRAASTAREVVMSIIREATDWASAGYAPLLALEFLWSRHQFAM